MELKVAVFQNWTELLEISVDVGFCVGVQFIDVESWQAYDYFILNFPDFVCTVVIVVAEWVEVIGVTNLM